MLVFIGLIGRVGLEIAPKLMNPNKISSANERDTPSGTPGMLGVSKICGPGGRRPGLWLSQGDPPTPEPRADRHEYRLSEDSLYVIDGYPSLP